MSEHQIALTVDGERETLAVEGRTLLVHALREELGVTAPKVGCESGTCGACTVELDGEAVKSCTILAAQADGGTIRTAAGSGDGDVLSLVQRQFHEEHALQCGYCTPGIVLTVTDLLREDPDPTESEIRHALKGNVCRCTGYTNIVRAVESAAAELDGTGDSVRGSGESVSTAETDASAPEGDD